jgi:thiopurine S-methyltransferase
MEPSFWRARWQEGRIGFHEGKPNAHLDKHVQRLGPPGRVFVPLCGKAEDLAFLASRGHEVIGVDLVESALRDFFREHEVAEPEESKDERFVTLRHDGITLKAGDLFALTKADVGEVSAAYDRASIVALPPDMRARYAAHLRALLPKGTPILTVTFDYDESRFTGPPFSVSEVELRRLYEGADIQPLETGGLSHPTGALATADIGAVEKSWLVTL